MNEREPTNATEAGATEQVFRETLRAAAETGPTEQAFRERLRVAMRDPLAYQQQQAQFTRLRDMVDPLNVTEAERAAAMDQLLNDDRPPEPTPPAVEEERRYHDFEIGNPEATGRHTWVWMDGRKLKGVKAVSVTMGVNDANTIVLTLVAGSINRTGEPNG